jgi:hypothetical protein
MHRQYEPDVGRLAAWKHKLHNHLIWLVTETLLTPEYLCVVNHPA